MSMPKWRKGATEFTVGVNYNEIRGYQCSIPKPVMDKLGNHVKSVTFVIKGGKVELKAAEA